VVFIIALFAVPQIAVCVCNKEAELNPVSDSELVGIVNPADEIGDPLILSKDLRLLPEENRRSGCRNSPRPGGRARLRSKWWKRALPPMNVRSFPANSPFDRWRYGHDEKAVSSSVKRGFVVFTSKKKGNCAVCHTVGKQYALFTDIEPLLDCRNRVGHLFLALNWNDHLRFESGSEAIPEKGGKVGDIQSFMTLEWGSPTARLPMPDAML
jgi:hypothetical protein